MNRANVKILMLCCAVAAMVCWLLSHVLYRQPTPEELSLGAQYLALDVYQRTNEFTSKRALLKVYANTTISNAIVAGDTSREHAARLLLGSVLEKDLSDAEDLRDLLLQAQACAEGRRQQQLRFVHIAEFFCGAILFAAIILFATAPKAKTA